VPAASELGVSTPAHFWRIFPGQSAYLWSWGESYPQRHSHVSAGQGESSQFRAYFRVTVVDRKWPLLTCVTRPFHAPPALFPPSECVDEIRPRGGYRRRVCVGSGPSGDVKEPAEGFSNDLTGRGVVSGRAGFDGGAEFGVESYRYHFGGARAHGRAAAARSKCGDVIAGFGLGGGGTNMRSVPTGRTPVASARADSDAASCSMSHSGSGIVDQERGASLAVRHLIELGHREIAHVAGPLDDLAGFLGARRSSRRTIRWRRGSYTGSPSVASRCRAM
jgi:hypothetical protein